MQEGGTKGRRMLFVYGTLMDPGIRKAVMGRTGGAPVRRARLTGYRRRFVAGAEYPAIAPEVGAIVDGLLLAPQPAATLERLDAHEGDEYVRRPVAVTAGGRIFLADAYVAGPKAKLGRGPWRLGPRWARRRAAYLKRQFPPSARYPSSGSAR